MTESEMEIHQRIDVMGDRIEELEKIVDDQVKAFTDCDRDWENLCAT